MKDILKQTKLKHSYFTPRNISKRSVYICSSKDKCKHVHSNIIPNNRKQGQPKCPSILIQISKLYIRTMEHYTAMRKKSTTIYTTTWVKLKDNVRLKVSDTKESI